MINWLQRMMYGRYGNDRLNQALSLVSILLLLLTQFTGWDILYLAAMGLLVYSIYRMMSKDIGSRYRENQRFLSWIAPMERWLTGRAATLQDRKTHRHFQCPKCAQKIRVPRGKGKICITCPRCKEQFVKKS